MEFDVFGGIFACHAALLRAIFHVRIFGACRGCFLHDDREGVRFAQVYDEFRQNTTVISPHSRTDVASSCQTRHSETCFNFFFVNIHFSNESKEVKGLA